ncbi:MAG: DNRLRE domain-containing protein [Verrucomicrobiota bacterium]
MKARNCFPVALTSLLLGLGTFLTHGDTVTLFSAADTGLRQQNANNNLGGIAYVPVGTSSLGAKNRGLFKFNITGNVPANATITSATILLTSAQGNGSPTHNLHRVLENWGEGNKLGGPDGNGNLGAPAGIDEATWNDRLSGSTAWSNPGAAAGSDFVLPPSGSGAVGGSGPSSFGSVGMANDVQLWLTNPSTNFGWILIIADETVIASARRISSREDPNTNKFPKLVINYTLPGQAQPTISQLGLIGNQVRFSFDAEANQTYIVEFRNSLSSGDWATLTNFGLNPSPGIISVTNTISSTERYFRVRHP